METATTSEHRDAIGLLTVILSVVLYDCETWTLTLREEHRLRVFENKVLRKIFGAKRDEVAGEWRKLHNTEQHALYSSPDVIRNIKSRRLRWAGHVARMGESKNAYRVLVERPEGKRPLGRPRRRWEGNIKMDFREVGYDGREWINLGQDRDQWRTCEGGNERPGSLKASQDACLHPLTEGGILSTTVPQFPAFHNISARIHSLRALPRVLRHHGMAVGMDPVLLVHLGGVNLGRGRLGGPHWVSG
ncbi:hypothetical protein ANN_10604 [Periplaneta americana]|uniref:Uncharacterized protein n=1 Tax=Periplaneta americana TaxID=6978 RepID=A0ABQ8TPJ2_PERAM|nr:hypothetical protein ANN_10604 [Periplaneta americana]